MNTFLVCHLFLNFTKTFKQCYCAISGIAAGVEFCPKGTLLIIIWNL
jgi:hypothetical protein